MSKSPKLLTVADVIAAFGGPKAMVNIFGGVRTRFANYKLRGEFPSNMHMEIFCECMRRGFDIAPELVGMTPDVVAIVKGRRQRELHLQAAE